MSLLHNIIDNMLEERYRTTFIAKMHDQSGMELKTLAEAYDAGYASVSTTPIKSRTAARMKVFTVIEETGHYLDRSELKRPRRGNRARNYVAKHDFNRGGPHQDVEGDYKSGRGRRRKHRKPLDLEASAQGDTGAGNQRSIKFAKHLAFKLLKGDHDAEDARNHADILARRGEAANVVAAWRMAADMIAKNDKKVGMGEGEGKSTGEDEYQIWDTRKSMWIGKPVANRKRLTRRADKLDNQYGAVRYQVRRITK